MSLLKRILSRKNGPVPVIKKKIIAFLLKHDYVLLRTNELEFTEKPPINIIPDEMYDDYTLNKRIPVIYKLSNGTRNEQTTVHNTEELYKKAIKKIRNKKFQYYNRFGENEGGALYAALEKYPLKGKTALVWGLAGCNCEAIALAYGASKVYVVDYNKPICDHENIVVLNHAELQESGIKTDFAFSYSSFEHDGLGAYGDPLRADGDVKAMKDAYERLTDDGILLLGVPLGQDCLWWNGNRIYGKLRLPLMLKGFKLLDVFDVNNIDTPNFPFDLPLGKERQNVLVLQKIRENYPDDAYLLEKIHDGQDRNKKICGRICQMILERG
jgi:hypothetical protein